jgi:hypothetical protein
VGDNGDISDVLVHGADACFTIKGTNVPNAYGEGKDEGDG